MAACQPFFKGVGDKLSQPELLLSISRLLNKASLKLGAKARVDMAEEDMGGGRFDEDVRTMSDAAASYQLPQQYDAGERQALDESLVPFNKPMSFKHYKTGTYYGQGRGFRPNTV